MLIEKGGYRMRGHIVHPFKQENIIEIAARVCKVMKFSKRCFLSKNIELWISDLEKSGINVDTIADSDWLDVTRATVDPQKAMIYMPEKLYSDLCRGKAEAIRIFLHELGHIFLCHRPLLHFSGAEVTEECDSEWQADLFADAIIERLRLPKLDQQLEFAFYVSL